MNRLDVGVLSIGAPERRIVSGGDRTPVQREDALLNALRTAGHTVLAGGSPYPEEDRLATTSALMRTHVHTLVDAGAAVVIANVTEGGRGADVAETVRYFEQRARVPCRLILYADTSAPLPTLASCTAASAALRRGGHPHAVHRGLPADRAFMAGLEQEIAFLIARERARPQVQSALSDLGRQKLVSFGPSGSRVTGESIDADALVSSFGINLLGLPLQVIATRASELGSREASSGRFADPRLEALMTALRAGLRGDDARGSKVLAAELADYLAATDLMRELGGNLATLAHEAPRDLTLLAALLSQDEDPMGGAKDPIPTAPDGDALTALSMRTLGLLARDSADYVVLREQLAEGEVLLARGIAAEGSGISPAAAAEGVLLRSSWPREPGPATMARWSREGNTHRLHVIEGTCRDAGDRGGGCAFTMKAPSRCELVKIWPAPSAAICAGSHRAALTELAHTLGLPF